MEQHERSYPLLSACGLNCGLCPRFHTDGDSRCPGCGGPDFARKHPPCGVLSCARRRGVEYCFECSEYPCAKFDGAETFDSFITHRNMLTDFARVRSEGLDAYRAELDEKVALLLHLLERYNDGRRKSFLCTAVNLLPLADVRDAVAQLDTQLAADAPIKERAAAMAALLNEHAQACGLSLKLRKKER